MERKDTGWLLVALLVVGVAACNERPTGPEDAGLAPVAALGRPSGEKPGKPSSDIPLTVIFTDDGNRIRSDLEAPLSGFASDTYVDGEDFVSAKIKSSGQFYFQAFSGKKTGKKPVAVLRGVTVELGPPLEAGSLTADDLANLEAFADEVGFTGDVTGDWPAFTSDVTLHTRSLNGGMKDMGASLLDAGKIAFNDYGGGSWEWRLLFGARIETPEGGVDHYEEGLCVTYEDGNTWVVTNHGEGCPFDGVTELWRVVGGDFTHVADFNTPIHLTLTPK